jgi:hypothetical protein
VSAAQVGRIAAVPRHLRCSKRGDSLTRQQCRTGPDRAVIEDHAPSLDLPDAVATLDTIEIAPADNDLVDSAIDMRELGKAPRPYERDDRIRLQIGPGQMKRLEIDFGGGVIFVDELDEDMAVLNYFNARDILLIAPFSRYATPFGTELLMNSATKARPISSCSIVPNRPGIRRPNQATERGV